MNAIRIAQALMHKVGPGTLEWQDWDGREQDSQVIFQDSTNSRNHQLI